MSPRKAYDQDIVLLNPLNKLVYLRALLDTQCKGGNVISNRVVQEYGLSSLVLTDLELPEFVDASGNLMQACGAIDLTWRWYLEGTRNYTCRFYVLPDSDHLDVVFGAEFISRNKLLLVNKPRMLILVEKKKIDSSKWPLVQIPPISGFHVGLTWPLAHLAYFFHLEVRNDIAIAENNRKRQQAELKKHREKQKDGQQSGGGKKKGPSDPK